MKKALIICIGFLIICCSVHKEKKQMKTPTVKENKISKNEKDIVNDFLEAELKDNRYKSYRDYQICIIKERVRKILSLDIYEYCYYDRNLPIRTSSNKEWILNETQIKAIRDKCDNKELYIWEISDFTTTKVSILEFNKLLKNVKENTFINLPKRLIVHLSTPLIIDENYSFMSIKLGDSFSGFEKINAYTALLKKNKLGRWDVDSYYYDPNFNW